MKTFNSPFSILQWGGGAQSSSILQWGGVSQSSSIMVLALFRGSLWPLFSRFILQTFAFSLAPFLEEFLSLFRIYLRHFLGFICATF